MIDPTSGLRDVLFIGGPDGVKFIKQSCVVSTLNPMNTEVNMAHLYLNHDNGNQVVSTLNPCTHM